MRNIFQIKQEYQDILKVISVEWYTEPGLLHQTIQNWT